MRLKQLSVILAIALGTSLVASSATAEDAGPLKRALAAGYHAAFTCSGLFVAGKSLDDVRRDELTGIYPDYRGIDGLEVEIDEANKAVLVRYSDDMPPRVAKRAESGCQQNPIGSPYAPTIGSALKSVGAKYPKTEGWPYTDDLNTPVLAPQADGTGLQQILAAAFDATTYGERTKTSAVVIVKDGALIAEGYMDGMGPETPQRTWSVAKSLAATLIGAGVHGGVITVQDPAPIPEWQQDADPRGAITTEHLLHMASGLHSGDYGSRTDEIYFGGGRVQDHALTNVLEAEPGTRWTYANNDTLAAVYGLKKALERARGPRARHAAPDMFAIHQAMRRTTFETDWDGNYILSSQVWSTARDLARFGLLYLNDGVALSGERVLPEGWASYVATPAPSQPPAARADGTPNPGYGAQFWLFGERHGLPDGTYAAMGNRGQYLMIVPTRNAVIVRRGYDEVGGRPQFDIARFTADVLASLP